MNFRTLPLGEHERQILALLFRHKQSTQAQVAAALGLSQQTASRLLAVMIEQGQITPGRRSSAGRRGYPTTPLSIRPEFAYSAGLSVMAGSAALALIDFSGVVRCELREAMFEPAIDRILDWTDAKLDHLCRVSGLSRDLVGGLGIALSGSIMEDGTFNTPLSMESWANIDVAECFAQRLAIPVHADNDGNAAAVAESRLGVGRWARSFAYFYIATGVGGGLILDGALWRGRFGNAGEFAGGLPPHTHPFPNLDLLRQMLDTDGIRFDTVDAMVESYRPDWPANDRWIDLVGGSLSLMASNATAILDLEAIVLGGLIPTDLADRAIAKIELFDQKRRGKLRPVAKLVSAEAQGAVAAYGAALLPLERDVFAAGSRRR